MIESSAKINVNHYQIENLETPIKQYTNDKCKENVSWKKLKITQSLMPIFFSLPGNATQNGLLLDALSVINLCQQLPLQWFSLCDSHSEKTKCNW